MGGCDGCDGCDPENMPKDSEKTVGEMPEKTWGEKLADQAISDMIKPQKEPKPAFGDADVEAFLKKCDAEKKDPIAVIEHIAKSEGFKIFGERPNGDVFKENLYDFLRAVLKALVVGFFSYIVDKTGFGSSKLVQLMYELMKANRDNYRDDNESARDIIDTIKVMKYAFSW